MAQSQLTGSQIKDGTITKNDLNITIPSKAVITSVIPVDGIKANSSTGIDNGTGDVTISADLNFLDTKYPSLISNRPQNTFFAGPSTGTGPAIFRNIVLGDIPSLNLTTSSSISGTINIANGGTSATLTSLFLNSRQNASTRVGRSDFSVYSTEAGSTNYPINTQGGTGLRIERFATPTSQLGFDLFTSAASPANTVYLKTFSGQSTENNFEIISTREWTTSQLGSYVTLTSLNTQLANYATLAGTQLFTGTNTFNSSPIVPTPTLGTHAVNKNYVDNLLTGSYQPLDADLTSIAGLTGTTGLLRKTSADTWTLDTTDYYHSGNSNLATVNWSAQNLTLNGSITGATTINANSFIGALTGNASTATTLQNTRTINGTSFDGSANITTANWGTARNINIGGVSKSVNGSSDITWTLPELNLYDKNNFADPSTTLNLTDFASSDRVNLVPNEWIDVALDSVGINTSFIPILEVSDDGTTWTQVTSITDMFRFFEGGASLISITQNYFRFTFRTVDFYHSRDYIGFRTQSLNPVPVINGFYESSQNGTTWTNRSTGNTNDVTNVYNTTLFKTTPQGNAYYHRITVNKISGGNINLAQIMFLTRTSAYVSKYKNALSKKLKGDVYALDGTLRVRTNGFAGPATVISSNASSIYFRPNGDSSASNEMTYNTSGVLNVPTISASSISSTGNITSNSSITAGNNVVVTNNIIAGGYVSGGSLILVKKNITTSNFSDLENTQGKIWLGDVYNIATSTTGMLSNYGTLFTINGRNSHDKTQFAFNGGNGSIQYRKSWFNNGAWTDFRTLYDSNNSNSTTVNWSAQNLILNGSITGTTTINATGIISTSNKITSVPDKGFNLKSSTDATHRFYNRSTDDYDVIEYSTGFSIDFYNSGTPTSKFKINSVGNIEIAGAISGATTINATSFVGNLTGNATTATTASTANKLTTARTINGTSFDGSANITTANWGNSRLITIGSTSKSQDGSANTSFTLDEIGTVAKTEFVPRSGTIQYSNNSHAGKYNAIPNQWVNVLIDGESINKSFTPILEVSNDGITWTQLTINDPFKYFNSDNGDTTNIAEKFFRFTFRTTKNYYQNYYLGLKTRTTSPGSVLNGFYEFSLDNVTWNSNTTGQSPNVTNVYNTTLFQIYNGSSTTYHRLTVERISGNNIVLAQIMFLSNNSPDVDLLSFSTKKAERHKLYNVDNYLGTTYISGGAQKPTYFKAGSIQGNMLNGGNHLPSTNLGWSDVLWLSTYSGTDVKTSTAIWSSKSSNKIGFTKQAYDSADWGTFYEFWHSGNFNPSNYALNTQLNNYATLAGTQTFTGTNTFNLAPIVPSPTLGTHAVNKNYVDNNFKIKSSKYYNSTNIDNNTFTSAWVTIANVEDSSNTPVLFAVRAYAHTSVLFSVIKGYASSGNITILNFNGDSNPTYRNVKGVRLLADGSVQIRLAGNANGTINLGINTFGSSESVTLVDSLTVYTGTPSINDEVDNLESGKFVTRTGYKVNGGLSTGFLKADGSVDNKSYMFGNNVYGSANSINTIAGNQIFRSQGAIGSTGFGHSTGIQVVENSNNGNSYGWQIMSDGNNIGWRYNGNDNYATAVWRKFWHEGNFNPSNYSLGTHTHTFASITNKPTTLSGYGITDAIPLSQKGVANGVATLDSNGLVPASQLPSYVDDVLEFNNLASFPTTGEVGKIYVAKDTNLTYRWGGSSYIQIASGAVQSINGQTGVVNLSYSDVGAEQAFTKNTAFNKNFGNTSGTVAEGNDSRIINGQTAYDRGDFRDFGLGRNTISPTAINVNNIEHTGFYAITPSTQNRPFDYGNLIHQRFDGSEYNQIGVSVGGELYIRSVYGANGIYDSGWIKQATKNHTHNSLLSGGHNLTNVHTILEDGKLGFAYQFNTGASNLFPTSNNANSVLSIAKHPGGYGTLLGFNSEGDIFTKNVTGGNYDTSWKQVAYRDWVTTQLGNYIPTNHVVNGISQSNINNWNSKINGLENAVSLGFSYGLASNAPYIVHHDGTTGTYINLATQSWVNSQGFASNSALGGKLNAMENAVGLGFHAGNVNGLAYIFTNTNEYKTITTDTWVNDTKVHAINNLEGESINFDTINGKTKIGSIYDGSTWWNTINIQHRNGLGNDGTVWGGQIRFGMNGELDKFQFRQRYNGTYNDWKSLWHDGNLNPNNFVKTSTDQYGITGLKEFVDGLAIGPNSILRLGGIGMSGHYIKKFLDESDGFGISTAFSIKHYSTEAELFRVDVNGNAQLNGYLKFKTTIIDLTSLDPNTFYPIRLGLSTSRYTKIKVYRVLDGSFGVPPYSNHNGGFMVMFEIDVLGDGWGTTDGQGYLREYKNFWVNSGQETIGFKQLTFSSQAVVYVRGGSKYNFENDSTASPVLTTSYYEIYGQSCEPTTTRVWENFADMRVSSLVTTGMISNYVNKTSNEDVSGQKSFLSTGTSYSQTSLNAASRNNTAPTLGFIKHGSYGGTLAMTSSNNFTFYDTNNNVASLTLNGLKVNGITANSVYFQDQFGIGDISIGYDNYGGEAGMINADNGTILAAYDIDNNYIKYGSTSNNWEGINFNVNTKVISIGKQPSGLAKVEVEGKIASKGFIHIDYQNSDYLFTADGGVTNKNDIGYPLKVDDITNQTIQIDVFGNYDFFANGNATVNLETVSNSNRGCKVVLKNLSSSGNIYVQVNGVTMSTMTGNTRWEIVSYGSTWIVTTATGANFTI